MKFFKTDYILLLIFAAMMAMLANIVAAETVNKYRFSELPWGIDSPAGRCVVCHSLEKNGPHRVAPNLWGIAGGKKAAKSWYNYSKALRNKGGVWTEKELDEFLADADRFARGSTKSIRVSNSEERKAIIDYLKKLR